MIGIYWDPLTQCPTSFLQYFLTGVNVESFWHSAPLPSWQRCARLWWRRRWAGFAATRWQQWWWWTQDPIHHISRQSRPSVCPGNTYYLTAKMILKHFYCQKKDNTCELKQRWLCTKLEIPVPSRLLNCSAFCATVSAWMGDKGWCGIVDAVL